MIQSVKRDVKMRECASCGRGTHLQFTVASSNPITYRRCRRCLNVNERLMVEEMVLDYKTNPEAGGLTD
jgi:hypothetical protein